MIIYTSETCPYCKQVKEELDKNKIKYTERLTTDWEEKWRDISQLTGLPTVPTIYYENSFIVPGRDFRNAVHLVEIIKNYKDSTFQDTRHILEKIKTLTYNMHMAFGRTDQLLKQIESKLNIQDNNEKV